MDKTIDEMSDEEIQAMNPPEISEDVKEDEEEVTSAEDSTSVESEADDTEVDTEEEESTEDTGSEETEEPSEKEPEIDYKGFYETVMSPIKANGKEMQLRNPQEAIRLMQMGANYTQKMQSIAPYRKKIQMLKNAGLLEDEKLNYLIDLSQGNPEAVQKLLKDNKLDPLDLNIDAETRYVPGNHTVSDSEVQVQSFVDDLRSTPEGQETLRQIQSMDQASLNTIWQTPSIMATLHEQRQNGVYDFITKEMDRQKMLGNIPEGTSFIDAYKAVGDYCLQQQQALYQQRTQNLPRGTLNKSTGASSSQVKSAAPSGRSKKVAQQMVDPFTLSDEEFEKMFKNYS